MAAGVVEVTAGHADAALSFRTRRGQAVQARVASSFISAEQAERNLLEIGNDDFEAVKQKGRAAWNRALGIEHSEHRLMTSFQRTASGRITKGIKIILPSFCYLAHNCSLAQQ